MSTQRRWDATVRRRTKKVKHTAHPRLGGREYETACGWIWQEKDVEVYDDEESYDCGNCRSYLEVWE